LCIDIIKNNSLNYKYITVTPTIKPDIVLRAIIWYSPHTKAITISLFCSNPWKGLFNTVSGVGRSYLKCTHWGFWVFPPRYMGTEILESLIQLLIMKDDITEILLKVAINTIKPISLWRQLLCIDIIKNNSFNYKYITVTPTIKPDIVLRAI
jgi:hypothetical protein